MYILGLTGSIATGKTTVAGMFEDRGVPVFHSDRTVHDLFKTRKRLQSAIKKAFPGVVGKDGVDRKVLGEKVFGNPKKLARLEQIVHPYVLREMNKFLRARQKAGSRLIVLDIPLLFEIRAEDICDGVLVVTVPERVQKRRALARKGFDEKQLDDILRRQMPVKKKLKKADFVIDTGASLAETRKAVEKLVAKLSPKGA